MRICGVVSWYDESPSWLAAVVTGLGRFCDEIVAVDGAYALYPGARPRSFPQQAEAVMISAEAAGVGCTLHRPKDVFWGNEVEKRNLTVKLAGALLSEDDWIVVFDSDMHVAKCEPEIIRWELENTDLHVATITTLEGMDVHAKGDRIKQFAIDGELDTEWTGRCRLIYRYHPTLQYGPAHWYVQKQIDGRTAWLWGPNDEDMEPCLDLNAALVSYHRTDERAQFRRDAQQGYYKTRDARHIEEARP